MGASTVNKLEYGQAYVFGGTVGTVGQQIKDVCTTDNCEDYRGEQTKTKEGLTCDYWHPRVTNKYPNVSGQCRLLNGSEV